MTVVIVMPFFYSSGEEIRPGDRVLIHGEAGEIEFIADPAKNPDDWYIKPHFRGFDLNNIDYQWLAGHLAF
jgi:hypothetical protein